MKGTTKVVPFVLGSAARRAAPPSGDSNARGRQGSVGKAAPAQFSAADSGSEFTAHSRRRPEGRLGGPFEILSQIGNIDFNCPFQKERHA